MRRPSKSILVLWGLCAFLLLVGAWAGGAEWAGEPGAGAISAPSVSQDAGAEAPQDTVGEVDPAQALVEGDPFAPVDPELAEQWTVESLDTPLVDRLRSLLGLLAIGLIAWLLSVNRRKIPWRVVIWGVSLQLLFAIFILKTPMGAGLFAVLNTLVVALLGFTVEGARFIFGDLVFNTVPVGVGEPGMAPMEETTGMVAQTGAFFAFNVLPTIIFFSSLMSLLYHLGVMQILVRGMAWVMQKTMRTSGAETLSAAGNIFVGQTEAPLLVKPFVARMTNSELMAVMTGGFATVAGGVLAAFVGMLVAYFPDIAGHLIAASVMSAPAALVIAKIMVPEDGDPETATGMAVDPEKRFVNSIDAAAGGAAEGLQLALNVGAMLLAFIALIAMINAGIGWMGGFVGYPELSLELILGWGLAPLAWLMGVTWTDAVAVGSLMGLKTVVNEFVAFLQLSTILGEGGLEPRSVIIATYALSGFANFSSIAIQIGGIGGIAPSRRQDLSRLGLRAMIAGSLAAFMTATIAGMLL
ncbi:MAG: NupC/NupG family nucleoside CNT transporter [Gemmatimonadales bacterium]|nr:MAG: NupC/NupG family nucleoside CNT transporter [Gemmatimonadales bacterium]